MSSAWLFGENMDGVPQRWFGLLGRVTDDHRASFVALEVLDRLPTVLGVTSRSPSRRSETAGIFSSKVWTILDPCINSGTSHAHPFFGKDRRGRFCKATCAYKTSCFAKYPLALSCRTFITRRSGVVLDVDLRFSGSHVAGGGAVARGTNSSSREGPELCHVSMKCYVVVFSNVP